MANTKVTARVIKDIDTTLLEKIRQRVAGGDHRQVLVGFPKGSPEHTPPAGEEGESLNMAQLASFHEFGTETVPERSFLRAGIRKKTADYRRLKRQLLLRVVSGKMTMEQALGLLGEQAKADVQMEITSGEFAPLAASTVRRKGSSKPLLDTGQLRQSVAWELGDD